MPEKPANNKGFAVEEDKRAFKPVCFRFKRKESQSPHKKEMAAEDVHRFSIRVKRSPRSPALQKKEVREWTFHFPAFMLQ